MLDRVTRQPALLSDLAELSKRPRLPSELLRMPQEDYSYDECFDFDRGILRFEEWEDARANERKPVRMSNRDQLPKGKNWTWGPMYASKQEIWAGYNAEPEGIDPDVEAVDMDETMTAWMGEQEEDPWETV